MYVHTVFSLIHSLLVEKKRAPKIRENLFSAFLATNTMHLCFYSTESLDTTI